MEDNVKLIERLLERVVEYCKTSFELIKLRALDGTSNVISTLAVHSVVLFLIASFMLFFNLGLAYLIGDILGKSYYGFFIVGGFYFLVTVIISLFMRRWIKRKVRNAIIKHLLK
jgi:Zn-dependent protease with chaperone function